MEDDCRMCELATESRDHIVEDCPALRRHRENIFNASRVDLQDLVHTLKFAQLAHFLEIAGNLENFDTTN